MTPEALIIIQGLLTGLTVVCIIIAFLSFIVLSYSESLNDREARILLIALIFSLLGAGLGGGGAWGINKARTGVCADQANTGAEND